MMMIMGIMTLAYVNLKKSIPKKTGVTVMVTPHFISCSRFLKVSVSKNSVMVISRPSQIFLMVVIPGFLL